MKLTEEEAKKKWCPMGNANSKTDIHCIASECMAFRWTPDFTRTMPNGMLVIVDDIDGQLLRDLSWWWTGRYIKSEDGYLHRLIMSSQYGKLPSGFFVDHKDGNPLNNRRGNLRLVSPAQNAANAAPRGGKSKYRGVHQARSGKWVAQISKAGIRLCLGTYNIEKDAAEAYDNAAKDIHGEFARLNLTERLNSGRLGFCGLAGKP